MKSLGFTGSGSTFTWPSESSFSQIGLQKSQFSDRDELKFTMNVTVADKTVWEAARVAKPYLSTKPAPNRFYGTFIWQRRIGKLLPSNEDLWWTLRANDDWKHVSEAVVSAVTGYVIPEFLSRSTP